MAVFTILAPQARDGDALPDPMALTFIKDGFNWPALFFAGPWLIYRRMWLVLIAYLVIGMGLAFLGERVGVPLGFAVFLLHIFFAFEANELRRWTLERHGHRLIGVAEGRTLEDAEIRFFSENDVAITAPVLPTPPTPPTPPRPQAPVKPSAEAGDVVGLFPAPGAT
jgi:hypothetical protein